MNRFQLGYLVALYEGEGTFTAGGQLKVYRLRIGMTDLDPLRRVQRYTGVGHIVGPHPTSVGRDYYRWQVSTRAHIDELILAMWPYLSRRRQEQILAVFRKCDKEELVCVLK